MAASKTLTFDIFGRDRSATKTIEGVGKASARMGEGLRKAAGVMAAGLVVAGAAAVAFGVDSVKAYAEAQQSQARLADAFSRFPKLADTNVKQLSKLNTALAKKTRFDDDATASGQAVLAQFGLTGKQLEKLTPLLQDFAAKTGQDLPTAAETLGKALLGQGRGLKQVGIAFTDTGSLAGNFDEIVTGLTAKVGGFAEKEGTTAAGKLEILRNRFGEVQEKIGAALMPALDKLVGFMNADFMAAVEDASGWIADKGIPGIAQVVDWVVKWRDVLGPAATAVGVLTAAQWLLNIAMDANPVGAVVLGLAGLIAIGAAVMTNFGGITDALLNFGTSLALTGSKIALALMSMADAFVNSVVGMLNGLLGPINSVRSALNLPAIIIPTINRTVGLRSTAVSLERADAMTNKFAVLGGAKPVYRDGYGAPATYRGGKALAAGGVVPSSPGGGWFNVGEGRHDEAVIPLTSSVLADIGAGIRAADTRGQSNDRQMTIVLESRGGIDLTQYIRATVQDRDTRAALANRMGVQQR